MYYLFNLGKFKIIKHIRKHKLLPVVLYKQKNQYVCKFLAHIKSKTYLWQN